MRCMVEAVCLYKEECPCQVMGACPLWGHFLCDLFKHTEKDPKIIEDMRQEKIMLEK